VLTSDRQLEAFSNMTFYFPPLTIFPNFFFFVHVDRHFLAIVVAPSRNYSLVVARKGSKSFRFF
jgi:hypothetical protein